MAVVTTVVVFAVVQLSRPGPIEIGTARLNEPAPPIEGQTLDGANFRLADLRGRPVIVNFWGPSCIPCRTEFPLLKAKLAEHAADGLAIVGVLMDDPVDPARAFVAEMGTDWPTVIDPGEVLERAYLVPARPQTYFVDAEGVVRAVQIGELTEAVFERQYAAISPS